MPVASIVSELFPTSTILARKMFDISMISLRRSGGAVTLNSTSSRSMALSLVRSVILCTLISLCSCLVICSYATASACTMAVTRDMVGSSVGPTASDSMLKPRREMSPVMREDARLVGDQRGKHVFHRFDSSVRVAALTWEDDRVSDRGLRLARGRIVRSRHADAHRADGNVDRAEGVVDRRSRRHHRVDVLIARYGDVEQVGAFGGEHALDGRVDVFGSLDALGAPAVRVGELDEIGVLRELGLRVAALVEKPLPLMDHAEAAVVHEQHLHGHAVHGRRRHLLHVHLKRPVARHAHHAIARTRHGGADGGGKPKPIVLRPRSEGNGRGTSRSMNWFAHI